MGNMDKTSNEARDADAEEQLAAGKARLFKNNGDSGRQWSRPENAGLGDREIKALERENTGFRFRLFHSDKRLMMRIIYDDDSGDVIVILSETAGNIPVHGTHQFSKFGVTMYWDGSGHLLGLGLSQEVSVQPEFHRTEAGDRLPLRDQELVSHKR